MPFHLAQRFVWGLVLSVCWLPLAVSAGPLDDVGWTQLQAEIGPSLENGSGILAGLVEASATVDATQMPPTIAYSPDLADSEFSGKSFFDASGINAGVNGHATGVSKNFFGNTTSMASGITDVTVFNADDWLDRTQQGTTDEPDPITNSSGQALQVLNHSYVGTTDTDAVAVELLQRVDYMVNRDNSTIVVGAANSGVTRDLLAPGYNSITVGVSDGTHSLGPTTFYGSGRTKPEIVAPAGTTSSATPMVSSAAAVLREAAVGTNASQNEAIKALLFAGATKHNAAWSRTPTAPLDSVYGVGQLNIRNSYHILQGGEQTASTSDPATNSALLGFDYESNIPQGSSVFYDFDLANGAWDLSVVLTWNIQVEDQDASPTVFVPVSTLSDLDLKLYDSTGAFQGTLVDSSVSVVDNVEHIYLTDLVGGQYTLEVSRKSGVAFDQDFAVAWQIVAVPEPHQVLMLLLCVGFVCVSRRFGSAAV